MTDVPTSPPPPPRDGRHASADPPEGTRTEADDPPEGPRTEADDLPEGPRTEAGGLAEGAQPERHPGAGPPGAPQPERQPADELAEPSQEVLEITAPEQFAALAHPLRQRLLFSLGHRPATISGLAAQLGVGKGNVAHHLKVLRTAGLVRVARTRQVRGGTEQYYQRVARRLRVAEPQAAGTAALFGAVAQELDRSPGDHLMTLRHVRLTPARARQLADALAELVDGAEEDGEGEAVHGVLVAMYEHASPGDTGSG